MAPRAKVTYRQGHRRHRGKGAVDVDNRGRSHQCDHSAACAVADTSSRPGGDRRVRSAKMHGRVHDSPHASDAPAVRKRRKRQTHSDTSGSADVDVDALRCVAPVSFAGGTRGTGPCGNQLGVGALWDLLCSVSPGGTHIEAANACLETARLLVLQLLGETASIIVQGSYAQGLALRGSDLDVAVIVGVGDTGACGRNRKSRPGDEPHVTGPDLVDRRDAQRRLRHLADELAAVNSPEVRVALRIFGARVPILRLHVGGNKDSLISKNVRFVVDLSVAGSLARGAGDRCIYALLKEDASGLAARLCRLMKLWAKRRQLTNTLRGGMSSFAVVLLTIFFLQQKPADASRSASTAWLPPYKRIAKVAAAVPLADPASFECPPALGSASTSIHNESCFGSSVSTNDDHQHGRRFPDARLLHRSPSRPPGSSVRTDLRGDLAALLAAFFAWACDDLPSLAPLALSVESGEAEPRHRSAEGAAAGKSPLSLPVPLSSKDNAARCLRRDVWERRVVPEIKRAHRLVGQITKLSAKSCSAEPAVRELFEASGATEVEDKQRTALLEEKRSELSAAACTVDTWCEGARRHKKARRASLAAETADHEEPTQGDTFAPSRVRKWKRRRVDCSDRANSVPDQGAKIVPAGSSATLQRLQGLRDLLRSG